LQTLYRLPQRQEGEGAGVGIALMSGKIKPNWARSSF